MGCINVYLFSSELNLEVLSALLGDPASKVQLVDLAVLVPQWGLIVHHKMTLPGEARTAACILATIFWFYCSHLPQLKKEGYNFVG